MSTISTIAIFGKKFDESFNEYATLIFKKFKEHKAKILIHRHLAEFLLVKDLLKSSDFEVFSLFTEIRNAQYVFSLGGDGTFLDAVTFVRDSNIPIVGINSGRLGFLADIGRQSIADGLDSIFEGKYTLETRTLIELFTDLPLFGDQNFALNELTLHKKDSGSMITIHTWLNDEYLTSYWADGLIVATPTGSTAYSLSVGGPIVLPNASNFILSPIAPHNLTMRPIVIPDFYNLRFEVEGRGSEFLASLDSRTTVFDAGIVLEVKKAKFTINVLKINNFSYIKTLRNKLMWGADKRN